MNLKSKMSLLTLTLVLASALASAAERIVLRTDYGLGHGITGKMTAPVNDRISGLGHILTGEPLGGKFDLVYQETSDGSLAQVFRCPTIRNCAHDLECTMKPQFWRCEQVYQADKKELCRYYVTGSRALIATQWAASELTGGLIVDQIRFLNVGVGLIINNLSNAYDIYNVTKDLMKANCTSNGLGEALKKTSENSLVLLQEKEKEQVSQMLTVFNTANSPKTSGQFPNDYQQRMKPLISVILDPTSIQDGLMQVLDVN